MTVEEFVEMFGDVAEHSSWIAERAFGIRPFESRDSMVEAFASTLLGSGQERQLGVLRAHPDLAGRAAMADDLTDDSRREQARAGLDTLTPEEFARFGELNAAYTSRFGFPFIFAVKGATKHQILSAFAERLRHCESRELEAALENVQGIIRFRIEERVGP